jgi:hypothetical protein
MNTVKALLISNYFDKQTAIKLKKIVESIDNIRWTSRTSLSAGRAIDNSTCRYDFCGHAQMPPTVKETFKELAPTFKDFKLAEIAINRYKPGDYLGKHKDRHYYRRNLVISLQEDGDGLLVDDTNQFVKDVAGQGVLFEGIGPSHSVPPVAHDRYTLIYLYE